MADHLMFVQFPHPGTEHRPSGQLMDWNRRDHARKFLVADGRAVGSGTERAGRMAFWGEWEPQSRVIREFPSSLPDGPRYLHEPFWSVPRHRTGLQNTDPLVFGDRFLYSNCRQSRNEKLRSLAPGSVIVFGSKLHSEFVLDTVMVVCDHGEDYRPGTADSLDVEPWIRSVVFDPLGRSPKSPLHAFRLYRGRSFDEAPADPFSFVPCVPEADIVAGFARPTIRLDRRWISPNLAMGAKATPATTSETRGIWADIVDQVRSRGLMLGVRFNPPPQRAEGDVSSTDLADADQAV